MLLDFLIIFEILSILKFYILSVLFLERASND